MISYSEIAACIITACSVGLAARNSIHTWWIGIVGCILYVWVFFDAKLYADVTLQLFFVVTSISGWINWRGLTDRAALPVRKTPFKAIRLLIAAAILVATGYAALLHYFTDAWSPWLDSIILTFSVLGQFLLIGRRMENWYAWLLVDSIAVPLYAIRGLYLTSALYFFFWCAAWYGLSVWRKELAAG